jgi:hypothetical protein
MQSQRRRNGPAKQQLKECLLFEGARYGETPPVTAKLGELSPQSGGPHNMWDAFSSYGREGIVN